MILNNYFGVIFMNDESLSEVNNKKLFNLLRIFCFTNLIIPAFVILISLLFKNSGLSAENIIFIIFSEIKDNILANIILFLVFSFFMYIKAKNKDIIFIAKSIIAMNFINPFFSIMFSAFDFFFLIMTVAMVVYQICFLRKYATINYKQERITKKQTGIYVIISYLIAAIIIVILNYYF